MTSLTYWTIFLLLGRLGDPVPFMILNVWKKKSVTLKNSIIYFGNYIKRVLYDISIIILAILVQAMVFMVPIAIIAPYAILVDIIPQITILNGIVGLMWVIIWPVSFLSGYLLTLLVRTILQTENFKLLDKIFTKAAV